MGKKILIVDDERDILQMLEMRLTQAGYSVLKALDGDEAVELAVEVKPDLIIMDIMMPQLNGAEAVRKIQAAMQPKHIPVIFLSAVVDKNERGSDQKSVKVGERSYPAIGKPFDPVELLACIQSQLI